MPKIRLRNTVEDNHDNTFVAWLQEDKRGKPVLYLEKKTGETFGRWSWYLSTLLGIGPYSSGRTGDTIALDHGQKWYVTGMKKLLKEAEAVAERKGLVIVSRGDMRTVAAELLDMARGLLAEDSDGSEVEEAEEVEPQGSTPIKERRKSAAKPEKDWIVARKLQKVLPNEEAFYTEIWHSGKKVNNVHLMWFFEGDPKKLEFDTRK